MTSSILNRLEHAESTSDSVPDSDRAHLGWAARLVQDDADASWLDLLRRTATGLGLSALYGLSLGMRQGGKALLQHAAGVPLGLALVVLIGGPSMFVFLSMCRAPIDARHIASTAARGTASAGMLLAGLAPAAALFVVTSQTAGAASGAVTVGLLLAGGVALAKMVWTVIRRAFAGQAHSVLGGMAVAAGFAVFAVALAARVWIAVLPILGGAS